MLLHATVGTGLIFAFFSGATLILLWWIYSILWLCAGLVLLLLSTQRNEPAAAAPVIAAS